MYKVIEYFEDLQDKSRPYNAGDTFPRKGLKVSEERIAELAGDTNRRGKPLIKFVEDKKPAKEAKKPAEK